MNLKKAQPVLSFFYGLYTEQVKAHAANSMRLAPHITSLESP